MLCISEVNIDELNLWPAEFLTYSEVNNHGYFNMYLRRISKAENTACSYFNVEQDDDT